MKAVRGRIVSVLLITVLMVLFSSIALAQSVTVTATNNPGVGNILADTEGKTLYVFLRDTPNVSSACYDRCAATWPPLLIAEGDPVAGEGVNGNLLGVLVRTDGGRQVMYNGMPLYYYATDTNPGDTKGQGVGRVWFVINLDADGTPAPLPAAPAPAAPTAAPAPAAPTAAAGGAGTPAQLPRTGGAENTPLIMLLTAVVLLSIGILLAVRGRQRKA
jgi:LPXTG-motif cell wall-anchored protein